MFGDDGAKTIDVDRVEVITHHVAAYGIASRRWDGVDRQDVCMAPAALRLARHGYDNAGALQALGRTDDYSGMLSHKFRRVDVMRKIDPIDLTNPRPTIDAPVSSACFNPSRCQEIGI